MSAKTMTVGLPDGGIHDAALLRAEAVRLGLSRPEVFDRLSDEELRAIWNGFGPDVWPEDLREAVTACFDDFQPVALIHDVDFHFSDGAEKSWCESMDRWTVNAGIVMADLYPLSRPRLWLRRLRAWVKNLVAERALILFGFPAWEAAFERRAAAEKARVAMRDGGRAKGRSRAVRGKAG